MTEKAFAESHHAFWHELLPLGEVYVRHINRSLGRFALPMSAVASSGERGLVNEIGFRLFARATLLGDKAVLNAPEAVQEEVDSTVAYITRMRQYQRWIPTPPSEVGIREAKEIANRLLSFFERAGGSGITCMPTFRGCGWIGSCEGDVLSETVLFEVKAGDRLFRGVDVRQVLCYLSLNFASKQYDIKGICLVNPRHGTHFHADVNELAKALSGKDAVELLGEIVQYISEPLERYRIG